MTTDHASRERIIRDLLVRDYLSTKRKTVAAVEQMTAERVREHFLRVLGYDDLADAETRTHAEIDLSRAGVVGIKLWIRDRATLNKLSEIVSAPFDGHAIDSDGQPVDDWDALARMALLKPGSKRSRAEKLDPIRVAVALATFYLTERGGGRLAPRKALDRVKVTAARPGVRPHPMPDEREWRRLVTEVQERHGPLVPRKAGDFSAR